MSDDIQLQKAIYASIQTSKTSAAHRHRFPGQPCGDKVSPAVQRSLDATRRTRNTHQKMNNDVGARHGRVDSLRRNGLVPAQPCASSREAVRARRGSSSTHEAKPGPRRPSGAPERDPTARQKGEDRITVHSRDQPLLDSISEAEPPPRRAPRNPRPSAGAVSKAAGAAPGGWSRWMGSGTFSSGEAEGGLSEGFLESLQDGPTALLYEPRDAAAAAAVASGSFRLTAEFKCAHAAPASGHRPAFDLLLVGGPRPALSPRAPFSGSGNRAPPSAQ